MSWELLPTNYTDAVWSGLKRYNQIDNQDGTVSFQDVTQYSNRENSFFGALQANRMNEALNTIMSMVENGTSLYEAFQNYFNSQKTLFEDEMDIKREELSELFAEFTANYQSDINQFEANQEQIFNTWFNFIKGQLGTDAAGNLQNQIIELADTIKITTSTHTLNASVSTTLTIQGVTANTIFYYDVTSNATNEQVKAFSKANYNAVSGNGSIVFTARGAIPSQTIPIVINIHWL